MREPSKKTSASAQSTPPVRSTAILLLMTSLDTTWRIFIPILAGTFLGIGLDKWLNIIPVATVICLIIGVVLSAILVIKQLNDVRKPR